MYVKFVYKHHKYMDKILVGIIQTFKIIYMIYDYKISVITIFVIGFL